MKKQNKPGIRPIPPRNPMRKENAEILHGACRRREEAAYQQGQRDGAQAMAARLAKLIKAV